MDIMLDLAQLKEAKLGLEAAIGEFDHAADVNDDLEDAIRRPAGRGDLLNQVIDFEVAWRDKRGKLHENLANIKDQLASIIDGWAEWDTTTAHDLEGSTSTQQVSAGRVV